MDTQPQFIFTEYFHTCDVKINSWTTQADDERLNAPKFEIRDILRTLEEAELEIINDSQHSLQKDHSIPEREIDLEQNEIEKRENTNLRILEWMHYLKNKVEEAQSIQQVDVSSEKHVKTKDPLFGWTATDRPLEIPPNNLDSASSMRTSIIIFVRGVGKDLPTPKI